MKKANRQAFFKNRVLDMDIVKDNKDARYVKASTKKSSRAKSAEVMFTILMKSIVMIAKVK